MPIVWTENEEANKLLDTDPLALLIGMVLDQQVTGQGGQAPLAGTPSPRDAGD